uniref:mitogen-activated protein kinase kinase n=1 Tax=Fibrocapsa japonica TaxID=94617 RepID=A0A7S2XY35_9STRA
MKKRGPDLKVSVCKAAEDSFNADSEMFIKGDVAINSTGVVMRDSSKSFTVVYEELEIGDVIGRGASSVVVHAMHIPTGTPLALKVINMFDKSKRKQLIREIETLYNAECPSLVTFYGAFYRQGAITIALEYMEGGALANVVAQMGPIPEAALANMTYQILQALAYMKNQKRVHRDLKPSNLLINGVGQVKLTDFGISAELQSSFSMCATFVGTFKYMSPERIQSKPYSYASDIWSLGLVLLECATGVYPFAEEHAAIDMVQTILEAPVPSPDPDRFSPDFCFFIEQCLQKDPSNRLPAEALLGSPWMQNHGAIGFEKAIENVKDWIEHG